MVDISMNNWMRALKNDRMLIELCLPGSHDAGVYKDVKTGVNPGSKARCQHSTFWEQALAGSRVFDVRCFVRTTGGFLKNRKLEPTMGHFFKEGRAGYLGDYGGTLQSALEDAASFLTCYPSEFIIFRIGHTKCTGNVKQALAAFQYKEVPKIRDGKEVITLPYADILHMGFSGNLAYLTVEQLRSKLLLVFDKEFSGSGFSPQDGYYPYFKYPTIASGGLTFCGKYSGGLGKAFALKSASKGNWSAEGAVKLAIAACQEHLKHEADHLLWIYWQETGGNVWKNTTGKGGMHERLDLFLSKFRDYSEWGSKEKMPLPNVIGHDFVNKDTCRKIVKLNADLANEPL